jgi:endoglucanase
MKTIKILIFLSFLSTPSFSQMNIFEVNKKLGKGVNMGNMFESPTEGEWGSTFKDEYVKKIKDAGLNHIRIPIRWDTPLRASQTAPFTLNSTFVSRIKSVVDLAVKEDLYVIINMHHHESMFTNPAANTEKFLAQWTQITSIFKEYDQHVVFEVLNEPHDAMNAVTWNPLFKKTLEIIRKTSSSRAVIIGPPNYNSIGGLSQLEIPNDPFLILSIHYYDPFNFTHQGADWVGAESIKWLGTKWENTLSERNEVIQSFEYVKTVSKAKNIPVNVGEFGAFDKADLESRLKWTNFLARWFEEQGFSWAYWEFSAGFGIYDPLSNTFKTSLANALIKDPMYAPFIIQTNTVYESNIGNASDVWNLGVQGTAKATAAFANGIAKVNITQPSTEDWHIQLIRNNIKLEKGKRYFVSFEVEANTLISTTQYMGKSGGDYASYSGYKGFSTDKNAKFSYTFTMNSSTDNAARIVFDLGKSSGNFGVKNFKIEEEKVLILGNDPMINLLVFPNPSNEEIMFKGVSEIDIVQIYDLTGRMVLETVPVGLHKSISVKSLSFGKYVLLIKTKEGIFKEKFIKK